MLLAVESGSFASLQTQMLFICLAGGGDDGDYSDEEEEGYISDDSVDPDDMTYEVRSLVSRVLWQCQQRLATKSAHPSIEIRFPGSTGACSEVCEKSSPCRSS